MPGTALVPKNKQSTTTEAVDEVVTTPSDLTEILAITDALLDEIDVLLNPAKINRLKAQLSALDDVHAYSLADAIREGASVTEQAIGDWTEDQGEKSCALSAAMLAIRARGLA